MKILLVTSDLSDGGGVNRVISNLAQIFARFPGLQIDVLHARPFRRSCYPIPPQVNLIQAKQIVPSAALNLLWNLLLARGRRYDHVLSFWTQENILTAAAFLGTRTRRILCEHFCHDQPPRWLRGLRILAYRTADKVPVLNSDELAYYQSHGVNAILLANPVTSERAETDASPLKQNLIIGVGHLIPRKGFSFLVRGCVKANIGASGWKAAIIGDGPEQQLLQRLIQEHSASEYIKLVPSTKDIGKWYRAAKLIVVPSASEVFSMVIPEAMAESVVPIAFAADGPKEILRSWPDNLVLPGDIDGLATAIDRAIRDPDLVRKASSLRDEAFARYSFEAIADEWKRLLSV